MFKSFRGGIRFESVKNEAKKRDIMRFDDVPELYISLRQDTILSKELTEIGSEVLRYQPIAVPTETFGVPTYSPVSGIVTDIRETTHYNGEKIKTIIIKNDGEYREFPLETVSVEDMEPLDIIELAQRAAIPGPNMYSRPEYMRLLRMRHRDSRTLVCNVAENELYLGHATRVAVEYTAELVDGLKLMMRAVGAQKGIIAATFGQSELISTLRHELASRGKDFGIRIAEITDKYPAHDRMSKMFQDMDMSLKTGGFQAGVTTPFACVALARAAKDGIPVVRRPVTVAGSGLNRDIVVDAMIGTPISKLLQAAGMKENINAVIMGTTMTGAAIASTEDIGIIRSVDSILAFEEATDFPRNDDCIHCGRCASVCPQGLAPSAIAEYVKEGSIKTAIDMGLKHCRLCGCCSYICPGRMELTQIMEKGRKLAKSNTIIQGKG